MCCQAGKLRERHHSVRSAAREYPLQECDCFQDPTDTLPQRGLSIPLRAVFNRLSQIEELARGENLSNHLLGRISLLANRFGGERVNRQTTRSGARAAVLQESRQNHTSAAYGVAYEGARGATDPLNWTEVGPT